MNGTNAIGELSPPSSFPLPFHVLSLVGLGILGWATNLHGLDVIGVDVISAMDLRTDGNIQLPPHHLSSKPNSNLFALYRAIYRIFIAYSVLCFVPLMAYRYVTRGDAVLADVFGYIPAIAALSVLGILVCPYNVLHKTERRRFLRAIRRCLYPPWDNPIYFSDVVLADVFTSFAQVLGDVWLSMCMALPGNSILYPPIGQGLSRWILPTIMSLPYLVRLRQCLIEYNHQGKMCRRPLYNALKYATSFPVIYLSAAQQLVVTELGKEPGGETIADRKWHGEHHLFRLWLLAAIINSLYSFWWDVTNDWGLELLKPRAVEESHQRPPPLKRLVLPHLHSATPLITRDSLDSHPFSVEVPRPAVLADASIHHPYGLRSTLMFPVPIYPLLIAANLVLRLIWSTRLIVPLDVKSQAGLANFCLKMAEIVRRWMWVFIRVEWEVIRKGRESHTKRRTDDGEVEYELIPATPERA